MTGARVIVSQSRGVNAAWAHPPHNAQEKIEICTGPNKQPSNKRKFSDIPSSYNIMLPLKTSQFDVLKMLSIMFK